MPLTLGPNWRNRTERVPRLLRFLGLHLLVGAAVGVAFASVVATNVRLGLGDLLASTESPILAVVMLYVVNVLTFGSLGMGIAIMMLPLDEPDDSPKDD